MARVYHRKAMKDYPAQGIAKGEMYYYTKIKTGPRSSRVMRSKTPFKRSALTQSDYLAQLYDWEDGKAEIGEMDSAQQFAPERHDWEGGEGIRNLTPADADAALSRIRADARRQALQEAADTAKAVADGLIEARDVAAGGALDAHHAILARIEAEQ